MNRRKSRWTATAARTAAACTLAIWMAGTLGCGKKGNGQHGLGGAQATRGAGRPGGPGGAPNGAPAEPPAHVAVVAAERGVAVQQYSTTATLEAENRAQVLARTSGVVAKLLFEEGLEARSGQALLVLDDSAARLRLRQAEVEVAKQTAIFERQKSSFEQEVIPKAEFDLAKTNLEAAQAALDLAQHELSYTHVQAPFAGTITQRLVQIGQTVNVGTPLFEIANFRPLLARIHVPAKEMGTLGRGQETSITLDSSGERITGEVSLVSPVVDPTTGTIKVTVALNNYPAGTRPGDFVQVRVTTARHEDALRVPNLAVFEDRGEKIVYVAQDSVAQRRPVQLGFIDETHTEVTSGVAPGEMVITKGQRSLQDGGRIKILEGGAVVPAADTIADRKGT
jgi:membrane fusion protein (multidrug efflux system)